MASPRFLWVGKKMFATLASKANHHGAGRDAVWCKATHVTQDLLVARSPERYFAPPYVGASGWVGIYLDDAARLVRGRRTGFATRTNWRRRLARARREKARRGDIRSR